MCIRKTDLPGLLLAAGLLLSQAAAQGYLAVPAGTHLTLSGAAFLVLDNTRWEQAGSFAPDAGTVRVTGNAPAALCAFASPDTLRLHRLELDKAAEALRLEADLRIGGSLHFVQGLLDLNGRSISLGSTGLLDGESEMSRITDLAGGGAVHAAALMNAPAGANPGNIGLMLSSSSNLGPTVLIRRHDPQLLGNGSSIRRSFDIAPAQNSGLNATLRILYFEGELNGLAESGFSLYRSPDQGLSWSEPGAAVHNPAGNWVELSGIDAFSRWTAAPASAFPVTWIGIQARWLPRTPLRAAQVEWSTASEQASDMFQVLRRPDQPGAVWELLGEVPAAGYSSQPRSYVFVDHQIPDRADLQAWIYRIRQTDLDGAFTYSSSVLLRADDAGSGSLELVPNPARASVRILAHAAPGDALLFLTLTDAQGRQVLRTRLDDPQYCDAAWPLAALPAGIYTVSLETRQGIASRRLQVDR
ncbi:MAG: hypothetical protein NW241_14550 [Bacteroidia bacterium]|nr:hypothetical protein [Bacteroidia bacterium]